jgi:hypothetical protein
MKKTRCEFLFVVRIGGDYNNLYKTTSETRVKTMKHVSLVLCNDWRKAFFHLLMLASRGTSHRAVGQT